jgi:hypothetical protein
MFNILHISDLHRSLAEPFNNDALLAALLSDAARYRLETPSIEAIDAIVISGDIIQGLALLPQSVDSTEWQSELKAQYDVAYEFLSALADRFIGGDRSQMIIVPGNHDVCWNTALRSMAPVEAAGVKGGVGKALLEPEGLYRWSWAELTPYKIVDKNRYEQRMDSYWSFAERFYSGASLIRPIDRTKGYNLFEIDQGRILVAAFDSIAGNDCFSFSGSLRQDAVARCAIELHDLDQVYDLRMAAWHHNIDGPPQRQDYMDVARIHEMTGHGFRLGLHGHQHIAAVTAHYIHLPESQAMAVISAGSLCAGARELPRGVNRQYNLITLNRERTGANVIVREMTDTSHFARKSDGPFAADGSISLVWERPVDQVGRAVDTAELRVRKTIERAEKLRAEDQLSAALDILKALDLQPGSYERALAISLATSTNRSDDLIAIVGTPTNEDELVHFVMAALRQRKPELAEEAIALPITASLAAPVRSDLEGRIHTYRAMNQ